MQNLVQQLKEKGVVRPLPGAAEGAGPEVKN